MADTTPCNQPDVDPNDWYIDRHGKQYGDEPWLSAGEKEKLAAALAEQGLDRLKQISEIARTEARLRRDALIRRRQAKQACFDCPIRLECLSGALERRESTGIWGGMYEEEIQKLDRQGRKARRAQEKQEQQGRAA